MTDASAAQAYRLFVAITIPESIKTEMEKAQAELRRALPGRCARWTKSRQFHLTLRFLGNVPVARVDDLALCLCRACEPFAPLELCAQRIGFFPEARFPRVIWVGISDAKERLPLVSQAVNAAVAAFTLEQSEEHFTGHVTLGRARGIRRREAEKLSELARHMAGRHFGRWTADAVELVRSELSSEGSRYTTLVSCPLGQGAEKPPQTPSGQG